MTTNPKPGIKKTSIVVLASIIVAAGIYSAVAFGYSLFPFNSDSNNTNPTGQNTTDGINYNSPTKDQKDAGVNTKESTATNSNSTPSTSSGDNETLQVTISALDQDSSVLRVRSLINKISNDGVCTLTLVKGNSNIIKTSDTQALPSESTCKGFDVPLSELSTGNWTIGLDVKIGTATGSATKTFAVE